MGRKAKRSGKNSFHVRSWYTLFFFFFSTMIIYDGHDSSEAIVTVDLTRILVTRINKQEDARKIYSRATKKYT